MCENLLKNINFRTLSVFFVMFGDGSLLRDFIKPVAKLQKYEIAPTFCGEYYFISLL